MSAIVSDAMPSPARARRLGVLAAVLALLVDQGSKLWLLRVFDLPARQPVRLAPVLDLVMVWNRGISYSLLWAEGETGRWLLIGGALGNVIDRVAYGAVADFVFFHVGSFRWYIFNGADCAIVVGVVLLLLDMLRPGLGAEAHKLP